MEKKEKKVQNKVRGSDEQQVSHLSVNLFVYISFKGTVCVNQLWTGSDIQEVTSVLVVWFQEALGFLSRHAVLLLRHLSL